MGVKVALVLEPDFGEQIASLAAIMPVWIVDSPANRSAVERIRDSGGTAVTTFVARENEARETTCQRILLSLDEHHNACSQEPEYDELMVIGVSLGAVSLEPFLEIGFTQFHVSPSGFLACKTETKNSC